MSNNSTLIPGAKEALNKMKFETALSELEHVIAKLESQDTSLDDAMKLYEKGMSLVRVCTERLESAEQKIKLLQMNNGQVCESDFSEEKQ